MNARTHARMNARTHARTHARSHAATQPRTHTHPRKVFRVNAALRFDARDTGNRTDFIALGLSSDHFGIQTMRAYTCPRTLMHARANT